jgi:hypothetical protein
MTEGRSKKDLMDFLEFCGEKGLMNPQTAAARKASVSSFLGILDENDAQDVTTLDLDVVTSKFLNLRGKDFKQDSVKVYKSRVESSIRDFVAYKNDPLGFKPNIGQRERKPSDEKVAPKANLQKGNQPAHVTPTDHLQDTMIFPIPIRPGLVVKVAGIPPDLSSSEARKIANVIMALAIEETF